MFFSSSFLYLGAILSGAFALPQSEQGVLVGRGSSSCSEGAGYYRVNSTFCDLCPTGYTCDGKTGPAPCDHGHAAPYRGMTGVCLACPAGTYQDQRGASACIDCPAGSWGPYPAASSCLKVPSGWFQSQPGMTVRCATCCGWEAMQTGNVNPTNCTDPAKPFAYPNSGSGCIPQPKTPSCVHAATCAQDPITRACPAGNMTN